VIVPIDDGDATSQLTPHGVKIIFSLLFNINSRWKNNESK
jgi:hypothetical protein